MENTANFGETNSGLQVGQIHAREVNVHTHENTIASQEEITRLMHSLSSAYRRQKDFNVTRTVATCEWFWNDERFQVWRATNHARLLHVVAGPGCGKSVLARALIDERIVANDQTSCILYFFFRSGQSSQEYPHSAIAAMLHQMFSAQKQDALKQPALERYQLHGTNLSTMFEELWDVLIEMCTLLDRNVVAILDAFDECQQSEQKTLVDKIISFYSSEISKTTPLKFLIFSRPYQTIDFDVQSIRENVDRIDLDSDYEANIKAHDVELVIEHQIAKMMPRLTRSTQHAIKVYLKRMKNRTYLWLHLTLDYVAKNIAGNGTETRIKALMSRLPSTVEDAYETMLNRSTNPSLTRRLLLITLAAKRPLSLLELNTAVALSEQTYRSISALKEAMEPTEVFRYSLDELCGLLLTVDRGLVQFLHETARDYLLSESDASQPHGASWKNSISLDDAEACFGNICIEYLIMPDLERPVPWSEIDPESLLRNDVGLQLFLDDPALGYAASREARARNMAMRWLGQYDLLLYASSHWFIHLQNSNVSMQYKWLSETHRLLENGSTEERLWINAYAVTRNLLLPYKQSALIFAVEHRMRLSLERLLACSEYTDIVDLLEEAIDLTITSGQWGCFWPLFEFAKYHHYRFGRSFIYNILQHGDESVSKKVFKSNISFKLSELDKAAVLGSAPSKRPASTVCLIIDQILRASSIESVTWKDMIYQNANPIQEDFARMLLMKYANYRDDTLTALMDCAGVSKTYIDPMLRSALYRLDIDIVGQNRALLKYFLQESQIHRIRIDEACFENVVQNRIDGVRLFLEYTQAHEMGVEDNYSSALIIAAAMGYGTIVELLLLHFGTIPLEVIQSALWVWVFAEYGDRRITQLLEARLQMTEHAFQGADTDEWSDDMSSEMKPD